MKTNARIFNCTRCHMQVVICRYCDRGNIYCESTCSQQSRALNHRIANQKYQKSLKGRKKHAERQRCYRQRQKEKVTDQGSPHLPPNDLLPVKPNEDKSLHKGITCCHFCGEPVSPFLRNGYLRHHRNDKPLYLSSWSLGP